jgi:hypothetical protein
MGNGYIDPHFIDLGTSWKWVVSFALLSLDPRDAHCIVGFKVQKGKLVKPRIKWAPFVSLWKSYEGQELKNGPYGNRCTSQRPGAGRAAENFSLTLESECKSVSHLLHTAYPGTAIHEYRAMVEWGLSEDYRSTQRIIYWVVHQRHALG